MSAILSVLKSNIPHNSHGIGYYDRRIARMSDVLPDTTFQEQDVPCSSLSQRDARSLIFHLLYAMEAWDYTISLEALIDNFNRGFGLAIDPHGKVVEKALAIINKRVELDKQIIPLLSNWRLERLSWSTRLILRLALWELENTDLDSSIVINEAIELAKCFAEHDAYKFVNGVLDEWVKRFRPQESMPAAQGDST